MIIELMKEALEAMERRNSVREDYKVYLQRGINSLKQAIELAEHQTPEFNINNEKMNAIDYIKTQKIHERKRQASGR